MTNHAFYSLLYNSSTEVFHIEWIVTFIDGNYLARYP